MTSQTKKRSLWNFADRFEGDKVVLIILLMLILFSIVCIFSSTSRLLESGQTRLDIVRSQLLIVALGLGVIIVCYNIKNIKFFRALSKWGFALSFVLLLLLDCGIKTPFVSSVEINGARRILQVPGLQIHVFEVVKVAMVMYLAWAMDALKKKEIKWEMSDNLKKAILLYAPFLITFVMVIPGSNSAALFIGAVMFVVILLGGGNARDLFILLAVGTAVIGLFVGIYFLNGRQGMGRIGTAIGRVFDNRDWEQQFLTNRPHSEPWQEALDAMRQPVGAKIAVKEGGILGKGPGQSTQRYVVPDISEDYMFSFIVEEYGLVGAILVIFMYVSLLARGTIIVRNCGNDLYAKLSVAGLCILISGQAFLHMFVNADLGPMTGQTLPLISHGNSAFLCFSVAFGIILSFSRIAARRIDRETKDAAPLVERREVAQEDMDNYNEFDDYGV